MSIFKRKKKQQASINMDNLPKHIAFIMDGNGRYATEKGMPRTYGHKKGVEALNKVIEACYNLGIKIVSFYMFSTENWKRPQSEVDYIFSLAREYADSSNNDYMEKGIKVTTMGDLSKLPDDLKEKLYQLKEDTKNNDKMIVNLGLNYGGRVEIVKACNDIINDGLKNVDEETFKKYLYTSELADPDIIVRTSGEMRVSNFMLYQLAYSEMFFPQTYWPDFDGAELEKIIIDFQGRNRRFGGLKS